MARRPKGGESDEQWFEDTVSFNEQRCLDDMPVFPAFIPSKSHVSFLPVVILSNIAELERFLRLIISVIVWRSSRREIGLTNLPQTGPLKLNIHCGAVNVIMGMFQL